MPSQLCSPTPDGRQRANLDLLVVTFSAVGNFEERQTIRATWGNITHFTNIRIAFFIGQTEEETVAKRVDKERETYNDLVQESYKDSWRNLTMKHVAMLDFVNQHCMNIPVIMRTDDDTYVSMPKVLQLVRAVRNQRNIIVGYAYSHAPVQRWTWSKYYVPWKVYGKLFYPRFCTGPAYIMTVDVIPKLFKGTLQIPFVERGEDAVVTGIVAEKQGIQRTHLDSFLRTADDSSGAARDQLQDHYAVTSVDPKMMRQIWTYDIKSWALGYSCLSANFWMCRQ